MSTRISRRTCLKHSLAAAAAAGMPNPVGARGDCPTANETLALLKQGKKIPVVFDTDIGGDIDDTWALALLLKSPELDVKLIVSDSGNTTYRARIVAKMLQVFGRTDIPLGVGIPPGNRRGHQSKWVEGYDLKQYPGEVHQDGVGAIIRTVKASADPVTIVCIGGVPNLREALRRDPGIVRNARFVGMHGSIRCGYGPGSRPTAEANVHADPKALRAVFAAAWDCTITPLDTCGRVKLLGEKFREVFRCRHGGIRALMENYRIWVPEPKWLKVRPDPTRESTTLFDTVAVYLAFSEELVEMEDLPVGVTDDGRTVIDPTKRTVHCATAWKDLAAFEDLLVKRLTA